MTSTAKKIITAAPAKKKNNTLSLFKSRRLSISRTKEADERVIKSDSFEFGASNEGETVDGSLGKKNEPPSKATVVGPRKSPPPSHQLDKHNAPRRDNSDLPELPQKQSVGTWLLSGGSADSPPSGRLSSASGRSSLGRRSSLKMDVLAPHMRSHLAIQTPAALITMLDEPSMVGGGSLAADRQTPAYASALKANEDAILSLSDILGEDSPDVIERKIYTADIYKGLGMFREACDLLKDVVEMQRRMDDADVNTKAVTMNDLAMAYSAMKRNQEAETLFQGVINLLSKAYDDVHPDVAVALGNMAICLRNTFQYARAIPLHERAVKIMSAVLSKDSPEAIYQKAQLGVTLIRYGERNRGQPILMDSLSQMEKLGFTSNHLWVKTFRMEIP